MEEGGKKRRKKDRNKKNKNKMGILYFYIVNDVVDEMKLSIHPSVPSSIQTQQIYILKSDPKCTHFPVLLPP
jgi:hypothetical protein